MGVKDYKELLEEARSAIAQLSAERVRQMLHEPGTSRMRIIDIRSARHVALGTVKGALPCPADRLQTDIGNVVPDRQTPIVLYAASSDQALIAARRLKDSGYAETAVMAGGIEAWIAAGGEIENATGLTTEQLVHYGRQMLLPDVGAEGQKKLLASRVLVVGAGGLGSAALLYLAASGVGTIGIVDADRVDTGNLHRQVIHTYPNIGRPKADSAADTIARINPDVRVIGFNERLTPANALDIMKDFDVVLDGSDNFQTKYLLNDAAFFAGKPLVFGAAVRTEGQASVFAPGSGGPCLRCMLPRPPAQDAVPGASEAGVLGVVPGQMGLIQATETLKLLLGAGRPLVGRFLIYNALDADFRVFTLKKDPACPLCGTSPTILAPADPYD
jgi:molybdopterin/thiamine biosynthesis adenylyltransferase/rhodanese-related sulfurtransferase